MTNPPSPFDRRRGLRLATRVVLTVATAGAFLGAASLSASADTGDTSPGSIDANVVVDSAITLALGQTGFTLEGVPGTNQTAPVSGTVTTNSQAGYTVGVQAASSTLTPTTAGNADVIPIADVLVTSDDGTPTPLSDTASVTTTSSDAKSADAGDSFGDTYSIQIPNVNSDTYTATLNYTATALS